MHLEQASWIRETLSEDFPGSTVLVTHHLPHRRSIHQKYLGSGLNPSFASDLSDLVRPPVALWIHGHTHESCDYIEEGTRVVCNPRGYAPFQLNAEFDPILTIEIDRPPRHPSKPAPEAIDPPARRGDRIGFSTAA